MSRGAVVKKIANVRQNFSCCAMSKRVIRRHLTGISTSSRAMRRDFPKKYIDPALKKMIYKVLN